MVRILLLINARFMMFWHASMVWQRIEIPWFGWLRRVKLVSTQGFTVGIFDARWDRLLSCGQGSSQHHSTLRCLLPWRRVRWSSRVTTAPVVYRDVALLSRGPVARLTATPWGLCCDWCEVPEVMWWFLKIGNPWESPKMVCFLLWIWEPHHVPSKFVGLS